MKQRFFSFPDGRQLSWYEAGKGAPLVLLHGWSISAAAYSEIAGILSPDYRLLIPDLPGHGGSSPAVTSDFSGMIKDLVAWIDAVIDAPVILSGWSLGGMLAIQLARCGSIEVERLALVGTTPRFTNSDDWEFGLPSTQVRALTRNLKRRFEATLADFFSLTFAGESVSLERLREIRNFAVRNCPLPDKTAAVDMLEQLTMQDQRGELAGLNCPVLVMHGALDQVSPVAAGRYIAETVPNGTFVEFPGAAHAPFWSQPEEFVARLREFF